MICPGVAHDCDNPGCRHGGCQGRPPPRPREGIALPEANRFAGSREAAPAGIAFEPRRTAELPRQAAAAR